MRRLPGWGLILLSVVVAGYALPYLVLSDVLRWYGTFLFWVVFGLCVWVLLVTIVRRWRLDEPVD